MKPFRYLAATVAVFGLPFSVHAGPLDGAHDFSLDADSAPGVIHHTDEDGTHGPALTVPVDTGDQVDALSGAHPHHDTTLWHMYFGSYYLNHSIDGDSTIFEGIVRGPLPVPLGPGRIYCCEGIHDEADELGLVGEDLDALEAHDHQDDSFHAHVHDFPGFPGDATSSYFSTERGVSDEGDIFYTDYTNFIDSLLYLDDAIFAPGENVDGLVVFDVHGGDSTFSGVDTGFILDDILHSDAIFYSLAPGATDSIGDNMYWYSAAGGGIGGLYLDPGQLVNWDALDVHVPEPHNLALFTLAMAGMGFARRKKS